MKTRPRISSYLALLALIGLSAGCSSSPALNRGGRPKLIVQIACDQLRGDLLERYRSALSGGFARVQTSGAVYTNAMVDHAPTNSYPGHVTLATGVNPRKHGIVDNDWMDTSSKPAFVGGVDDSDYPIVGFPDLPGVSPKNLEVSGLPDWVLGSDPKARFVAVSTGEYASLLQSGKARGDTYWFSSAAGRYVTSRYYREDYPAWLTDFQRDRMPEFFAKTTWNLSDPARASSLAGADGRIWEFDGVHTSFPHRYSDEVTQPDATSLADWLTWTPAVDEATMALATTAVRSLELGQRGSTDYLSIVLSATDSVGHRYGPSSVEQFDTIVRLDHVLGEFFAFLDESVGRDQWTVAITADHGASEVPEEGARGIRVTEPMVLDFLTRAAAAAASAKDSPEATAIIPLAEKEPFIGSVMRVSDLASSEPSTDPYIRFYRNSYFPKRTPIYPLVADNALPLCVYGLVVRLASRAVPYFAPSNHGTPYPYDRHVTMMFYGAGVTAGRFTREVHTTDVAPTLASIAGIPTPDGLDGHPLM